MSHEPWSIRSVACCLNLVQASDLPDAAALELQTLRLWLTQKWFGQQSDPIAPVTAAKYIDHLRCAFTLSCICCCSIQRRGSYHSMDGWSQVDANGTQHCDGPWAPGERHQ